MKDGLRIAVLAILASVILAVVATGLGFFGDAAAIWEKSKLGVWNEDVNRQVFEQSKSYNQGQIQQLVKDHHEWVEADAQGRKALESMMREQFADFDAEKIQDPDLREFLYTIRNQ